METHEIQDYKFHNTRYRCSHGIKFRLRYTRVADTALNTHIYWQKSVYPLNSAYSTFRYRPVISIIKLHKALCITRCYCTSRLATNQPTIFLLSQIESAWRYQIVYLHPPPWISKPFSELRLSLSSARFGFWNRIYRVYPAIRGLVTTLLFSRCGE